MVHGKLPQAEPVQHELEVEAISGRRHGGLSLPAMQGPLGLYGGDRNEPSNGGGRKSVPSSG
jgi:hypothetical protein